MKPCLFVLQGDDSASYDKEIFRRTTDAGEG